MAKKRQDTYRGPLSAVQIAEGMNAAEQNAFRLAEDAAILLAAGRLPTAASLATLSIEEAGKVAILRALSVATSKAEVADAWRDYRSHTRKNVTWLLPQLVAGGARKLDDLRPLFDKESDHPFVLDQVKQLGFYTDCFGNARWASPTDTVDGSVARQLVRIAQILAQNRKHTETEVRLWIEHVGPVFKQDHGWMKHALANWYAAMQEAGLAPDGPNKMEQFIRNGIQQSGSK